MRPSLLLLVSTLACTSVSCAGRDVIANGSRLFSAPSAADVDLAPRRRLEPLETDRATPLDPDPFAPERSRGRSPIAGDDGRRSLDDALLLGLRSAVIQQGAKSIGSTSLVFRVPLDGGLVAAFKPDTKKHRGRWRAEVAAYRLADALGLQGVPPSTPRAVKISALLASIRSSSARHRLIDQEIPNGPDALPGAMIAWLPSLQRLPLEREPLWTAWGEWLSATPPRRPIEERLGRSAAKGVAAARSLAPQIAEMVLFDHLTGNRDRWSGFNVMVDQTGTRLVYLDNNLAFDATIDPKPERARQEVLARVQKVPRRLVSAMRALTRDDLVAIFGDDDVGLPLLSDAQIDACLTRRDEILAHVDRLVAHDGEAQVLAFE